MPAVEEAKSYLPLYVTYGRMRMTGYFRHRLDEYVGGQKVVVQTDRGIELGELNVSHCAVCPANVNCHNPENVERREARHTIVGRILRIAGKDDLLEAQKLREQDRGIRDAVRKLVGARNANMRIVDAERLLGGDRIVVYFSSEQRVDFRDMVKELAHEYQTRIEMRQIGARDEAKLLGEGYGRCGQVLCCQSFLHDLAPVPMRMAKTQKGTLDPGKVSGRCGRLMCCLRYENETYEELRRKLPRNGSRVKTPAGEGEVVDGQILTQLVLVDIPGKGRSPFGVEDVQVLAPPQPPARSGAGRPGGRRDRDQGLERTGDDPPDREPFDDGAPVPVDEAAETDDRGPESRQSSPPAGGPPSAASSRSRADHSPPARDRGPQPGDRSAGRRGPPSRDPQHPPAAARGGADEPPARRRLTGDDPPPSDDAPIDDAPPIDDDRGGFDV